MKIFSFRHAFILRVSVFTIFLSLSFSPAGSQSAKPVIVREYIPIPSADGTILASSLALPDTVGTFPTIVIRSPYGAREYKGMLERYANRGYACLIQDTRGRYDSGGYFDPFVHGIEDGGATVGWIRSQPWSNGVIGTSGHSYVGFTSLYLAAGSAAPPAAIVAMHPVASPVDGLFRGGAMIHHFDYYWALLVDGKTQNLDYMYSLDWEYLFGLLPLVDAHRGVNKQIAHYRKWIEWANGSFGSGELPATSQLRGESTAFLLVGGWFDLFGRDVINLYNRLSAGETGKRIKLIVGPFDHSLSPPPGTGMEFGEWSSLDVNGIADRWLDHWLLGAENGVENQSPVTFFLLGENRWIQADSWPPEGAGRRSFYLHGSGSANTSGGDGVLSERSPGGEPFDRFMYDPGDPAPTKGGILCCLRPMTKAGPYDQSEIEQRNDILVFTTEVLTEDVATAGLVELELFASTSARDTDFTGKLVDVYPDGRALNITDGIIRARFRNGEEKPDFVIPGEVVRYHIDMGHTAITFRKGHRIRLEVSSSNFPRFDCNLNTGGPIGKESAFVKAEQTVYHDTMYPSRLILSVIDDL